jgi:hypothetical protein
MALLHLSGRSFVLTPLISAEQVDDWVHTAYKTLVFVNPGLLLC